MGGGSGGWLAIHPARLGFLDLFGWFSGGGFPKSTLEVRLLAGGGQPRQRWLRDGLGVWFAWCRDCLLMVQGFQRVW